MIDFFLIQGIEILVFYHLLVFISTLFMHSSLDSSEKYVIEETCLYLRTLYP